MRACVSTPESLLGSVSLTAPLWSSGRPGRTIGNGTDIQRDRLPSLARVERDFRSIKSIDLDLRPIHHWTSDRVRAHVFICMLAAHLVWHLRKTWAPLTFTDENRPEPADPVAPAKRSTAAGLKASTRTTAENEPAYSFTSLLDHLATLTRNHIHIAAQDESIGFDLVATPTAIQRRAFELIGQPIPQTLK